MIQEVKPPLSSARGTPGQTLRNGARKRLQKRYDQLWSAAIERLSAGRPELDPVLTARLPDQRRGLTVIGRPSPAVRQRVGAFLKELRALEPEQHYYTPLEFHLTVLSLFTATVQPESFLAQTRRYLAAVDSAVQTVGPLRIEFAGVTVSPGSVMVQGFFENSALNELRDSLRHELQRHGLGEGVDGRYRLETAHMTVVRFRTPLRDSKRLVAALQQARQRPFGTSNIASLSLVQNDWYMTHRVLQTLKRYRLLRTAREIVQAAPRHSPNAIPLTLPSPKGRG
jgi:2'-5' RNA ligase